MRVTQDSCLGKKKHIKNEHRDGNDLINLRHIEFRVPEKHPGKESFWEDPGGHVE